MMQGTQLTNHVQLRWHADYESETTASEGEVPPLISDSDHEMPMPDEDLPIHSDILTADGDSSSSSEGQKHEDQFIAVPPITSTGPVPMEVM